MDKLFIFKDKSVILVLFAASPKMGLQIVIKNFKWLQKIGSDSKLESILMPIIRKKWVGQVGHTQN